MDGINKEETPEGFVKTGSKQDNKSVGKEEKDLTAALSYVGILFLIPLLVAKDNSFTKFHVKQGLVLFIAEILTTGVGWIPILGWFTAFVAWIVWIVLALIGILNVLNKKQDPLPIIGKFSENFKF